MLLLSLSLTLFLIAIVAFFVLAFTRIVGSRQEVLKATEAGAIAAARSLSEIVIDDPDFGLIGLSDSAPLGKITGATDGFACPVRSINTLSAQVRLELIIADLLDSDVFRTMATRDYDSLMKAKDRLNIELTRVVKSGQSGKDKDGNSVSPYQAALSAYQANQIRMTGERNDLVPGSLNITLGTIKNLPTNTSIPKPSKYSAISQSDQSLGKYLAYRNIPYKNRNFVFAGIGPATALVDAKKFQETPTGLPYFVPTVVRCQLQQHFAGSNLTGQAQERTLDSIACAVPGAMEDSHPFPGGFVFAFDAGPVSGLTNPAQVILNPQFSTSPVDLFETASAGDFPTSTTETMTHPVTGSKNPMVCDVFSLALYDWIRRAGSKANLESIKIFFSTNFASASADDLHSFQWKADGSIEYKVLPGDKKVHFPLSEKQWRAVSGLAYSPKDSPDPAHKEFFDCYVLDYVYKPGRSSGGMHAGQPLNISAIKTPVFYDVGLPTTNTLFASQYFAEFPKGPGGGSLRPSYKEPNIAVLVHIHKR